jgi:hypothetical protein
MDGALPSVLGGLIPGSIICVPTSTGYGASRNGETALCAALSSCAPGLAVVNIDNGYGAACAAYRIVNTIRQCQRRTPSAGDTFSFDDEINRKSTNSKDRNFLLVHGDR